MRSVKCTNPWLEAGYKLVDPGTGNTIAVLGEDREFHRWEAGSWRTGAEKAVTRKLREFKKAMKAAFLGGSR